MADNSASKPGNNDITDAQYLKAAISELNEGLELMSRMVAQLQRAVEVCNKRQGNGGKRERVVVH